MANSTGNNPTPQPTVPEGGTDALGFDPLALIFGNPLIALGIGLVLLILVNVGIKKGWERLTLMYNAKGEPLPPLGFTIKRAMSLMYKEDNFPVPNKIEFFVQRFGWLTWKKYWSLLTLATVLSVTLLVLWPNTISLTLLGIFLFLWILGIGHLKKIFAYRHRTLMQMFEVAMVEMRFLRGAELNPWGYVQIESWENLYYPGQTIVRFPAKYRSEDERNRAAFEKHFSSATSDQHTWTYKWEPSQNRVVCEPVPYIVESAPYPFPDKHPWNEFPLGIGAGGEEAVWDVATYPHALVAGTTGSGKSVTQRTMLLHALQSPDWRVVLVDPKRVELSGYADHPNVLRVATELDDSLSLIEQVEQEMQARYLRMQESGNGAKHFKSLDNPPPAVLLMVDETFTLLSPSGIKSDEGKEQDMMKARIGILIGSIARLGRAAGIHMILATQRPDAKVLPGEVKANLDARIAQGRMDNIPSMMTLDSDAATRLPPVKGRAVLRTGNIYSEFQAYFLDERQLPMVIEMAAAIAQGDTSFLEDAGQEAPTGPEGGTGFKMPKLSLPKIPMPTEWAAKFKEWAERRQAIVDENERRAGRTPEARAERDEASKGDKPSNKEKKSLLPKKDKSAPTSEPKPSAQTASDPSQRPLTIEEIAAEARSRGLDSTSGLGLATSAIPVVDEDYGDDEDDFFEEYTAPPQSETPQVAPGTPNGLSDAVQSAFEAAAASAPTAPSVPGAPARPSRPVTPSAAQPTPPTPAAVVSPAPQAVDPALPVVVEDELDPDIDDDPDLDYHAYEEPPLEPAPPAVKPAALQPQSITVEEVMRRAAERGVPIPASELLAALRAEAARQEAQIRKAQSQPTNPVVTAQASPPAPPAAPVRAPQAPALTPVVPTSRVPEAPSVPSSPSMPVPAPEVASPAVQTSPQPVEAVEEPDVPAAPASPRPSRPARPTPPVEPAPAPSFDELPDGDDEDPNPNGAPWMPRNTLPPYSGPSPFGLPPGPPEPRQR